MTAAKLGQHHAVAVAAVVIALLGVLAGLSSRSSRSSSSEIAALSPLKDRARLWPPELNVPLAPLKVFAYDIPDEVQLSQQQLDRCRWSTYRSELILHDALTKSTHLAPHLTLVGNADEADVYWVPLFSSCYLFNCWVDANWNQTERCGVDEAYDQPIMRHIHAEPSWQKRGGRDHLLPHPMDHSDGYYNEESRLLMNSSIYLVTNGDLRPAPYSSFYRRHQDIVIPSSTHLLHSYYVNPRDYLDQAGVPYACPLMQDTYEQLNGRTQVELWKATSLGLAAHWPFTALRRRVQRTTTAIFRGGRGKTADGEKYGLGIRELFFATPSSTSWFGKGKQKGSRAFDSIRGYDIAEASENNEYARALARSKFGLVPPGYTLDTTRLWEYIAFGVVPVFVGTGPHAGQVMPFQDDFDYDSFSVFVPRAEAHLLPQRLASISEREYERLRENVWQVARLLVLDTRQGHVWKWIARDLSRMLRKGTGQGGVLPE